MSADHDRFAEVHQGVYGDWSVDDGDIAEVLGYRAGIILCALCATAVFAAAGATDEQLLPTAALNSICLVGTASFATSLVLIHIYVTEIKRTIQVSPRSSYAPAAKQSS